MSSFININNKEEIIEAKYSANVIRKALLISETKSSIKADKLTKNIDAPISLNEALVLFSDKLNAMRHLTKLSLVESEEVSQELNNNISELELNEGAMSEIHRLAQEAKDVVDFTKKFFKEFGDKIKKSTESTEWVQGLYNDVVSESKLEEGKSIGKIQKEYGQVVKDMITTVEEWKTAEGDRKKELLEKLRSLTAQKKQLSSDLDDAVGIKDLNVELAEDHSENPNDKYEVRPCDKPETPYGVWEGDVLVKCFETEEEADIYAKEQNKEQGLDESVITEAKFKKGQYIKAKSDSDDFDGDVYDKTNDVDGSEILKNSSFEIYEIGKDEVILWSDADEVEYSIDPDDLKNFVKESVITEANGQTVKEFGDLLALLLDEDSGMDIERAINAMPPKNARVLEKQISTLYKKLFDLTNQGFDLREDSSVANEAFSRMSSDKIETELYTASQALTTYYDWLKAGNDSGKGESIDHVISLLKKCKSDIKRFKDKEETIGTAYEAPLAEAVTLDSLVEKFEVVTEAKFDKKKLMKAMKADDGMIQLGTGEEYVIYAYGNGNDNNDDMWGDKTIFALDQDGEEHEIEYSDIVSYNESAVNEKDDAGTHLDNLADLVGNAKSFMNVGKELKAGNYKYDFSTGMMPMYMIKADGFKFAILNKKYVDGGDRVVGDIAIGLMESLVTEKFNFSKKEVEAAANLIASAISQADKVKAKVHDLEYDKGRGAGFEISIDGEKYDGGSYVVRDNGDVVNAAIGNSHPNAVYNTIGNKDIADVFINMEKYESVTNEDIRGDVKRFIKDNKDSLNDLADQDLWEEMYQKLYDEFGVEADTIKAKDLLKTFQFVF
jgi:hypothetical protein